MDPSEGKNVIVTQEIYHQKRVIKTLRNMLKIQMLEQILNNDENADEDARKSQVSTTDGSEPQHDSDRGYFVENGSTYNGWVAAYWFIVNLFPPNKTFRLKLCQRKIELSFNPRLKLNRQIDLSKFAINRFTKANHSSFRRL